VLGFRRLVDIRRRDVRELVEEIARKRDAPIMANRTLGVLCRMFNFALDREWIEANPASRIPEPGEEKSRDCVLSDEELPAPARLRRKGTRVPSPEIVDGHALRFLGLRYMTFPD
jgi:site-specific recombinase XerD